MPRKQSVKKSNVEVKIIATRAVEEGDSTIPKTFYLIKDANAPYSSATFVMKKGDKKISFRLGFQELYTLFLILREAIREFEEDALEFSSPGQ